MHTVKCFKREQWEDTDVMDLESGDIFVHGERTYVLKEKPFLDNGKTNVPAELYDSGAIVLNFSRDRDYIHMAMDYVCSGAHEFEDGTMIICEFGDGNTNVYSPRLPVAKLNDFCKQNIEQYKSFFNKFERELESGERIEMPKFW